MDKARFDKGLEVRTAVLGKDYVEASMKNADDSIGHFRNLSPNIAGAPRGAAMAYPTRPAACSTSR